ncbi:MAG: DUF4173 domain-containing protein [Chloroflexi bacterium]|nr:DUF4173 domain-containing protein [Chloroflexota bacterium]
MEPRIARRILAGALVLATAANLLFDGAAIGINLPIWVALAVVALGIVGPGPVDPVDSWLPVVAVAAAVPPALWTDPTIVALDRVVVLVALLAWALAVGGVRVTRRAAEEVVALGGWCGLLVAVAAARVLGSANADHGLERPVASLGRGLPVLRGLLVAAPVLAVFTLLLASADAVFSRGLELATEVVVDPVDPLRRSVWITLLAWPVAGLLAVAAGVGSTVVAPLGLGDARVVEVAVRGDETRSAAVPWLRRWRTDALTVLVAVDLLFAVFVALQVAYLFGGRDTLELTGLTYSAYARQGYFQLVAVVVLAGLLLVGIHAVAGPGRVMRAGGLVLLGLTAVILVSAAYRLYLYQAAYGWTELRFYVAASIAWLGAAIVIAAALLVTQRMRWLPHGLAVAAVVITLGVSYLGPQAFVVHQNVARVLDPSLVAPGGFSGFDAEYAVGLGYDSVPVLVAALDRFEPADRRTVLQALEWRRQVLDDDPGFEHWAAWNVARERAREALGSLPSP